MDSISHSARRPSGLTGVHALSACILFLALALGCHQPTDEGPNEGAEAAGFESQVLGTSTAAEFRCSRVEAELDDATEIILTRGFESHSSVWRGFLVEQAGEVSEETLRAGTCYVLVAAASPAMRQLELRVFDSDGAEVIQDAMDGPRAALLYCPAQTGTYYIGLRASAGSGLVEQRSFRAPAGLDIRIDDIFRASSATEPLRDPL